MKNSFKPPPSPWGSESIRLYWPIVRGLKEADFRLHCSSKWAFRLFTPSKQSIDRTKDSLFVPFKIGKGFVLGFCVFRVSLGQGGTGLGNFTGGDICETESILSQVKDWYVSYTALFVTTGTLRVVFGLTLG